MINQKRTRIIKLTSQPANPPAPPPLLTSSKQLVAEIACILGHKQTLLPAVGSVSSVVGVCDGGEEILDPIVRVKCELEEVDATQEYVN